MSVRGNGWNFQALRGEAGCSRSQSQTAAKWVRSPRSGLSGGFPLKPSCYLEQKQPLFGHRFALTHTEDSDGLISYPSGSLAGGPGMGLTPPQASNQGNWPASHRRVILLSLPFLQVLPAGVPAGWVDVPWVLKTGWSSPPHPSL